MLTYFYLFVIPAWSYMQFPSWSNRIRPQTHHSSSYILLCLIFLTYVIQGKVPVAGLSYARQLKHKFQQNKPRFTLYFMTSLYCVWDVKGWLFCLWTEISLVVFQTWTTPYLVEPSGYGTELDSLSGEKGWCWTRTKLFDFYFPDKYVLNLIP